ncbi:hypothetical protein MXB_5134, partial [Myxobolus squamalis]
MKNFYTCICYLIMYIYPLCFNFPYFWLYFFPLYIFAVNLHKKSIDCCIISTIFGFLFYITLKVYLSKLFQNYQPLIISTIALCQYHQFEFFAIVYSNGLVTRNSFLLNDANYYLAFLFMLIEYVLELHFIPKILPRCSEFIIFFGIILILIGDLLRKISIIYCGQGFSHIISRHRPNGSILVKNGPYRVCRHPSYVGWIVWAYGFTFLLTAPLSFLVFTCVINKFFSERMHYEEKLLIKIYGDEYIEYMKEVPIGIPF